MKILSISDIELGIIYSPQIIERFSDIDLVISCGDLPYYYLEYIISTLNVPLYFVRGNHAHRVEHGIGGQRMAPWGAVDLHERIVSHESGLIMAGIEGCLQYNKNPYQYTQDEMWLMIYKLIPGLLYNKIRYGRFLDIFVTHAPPWKIHDMEDRPHQGIKAFRWFVNTFQPAMHLHGHIHVYRPDTVTVTQLKSTSIINTYGFRELEVNYSFLKPIKPHKRWPASSK